MPWLVTLALHPGIQRSRVRFQRSVRFLLLHLAIVSRSTLLLRPAGRQRVGDRGECGELWRGEGVFGGQVGGSVVVSKELEDVVLVPDVNAVFLLVAGRTEGGARPLGFREERVIAQCP